MEKIGKITGIHGLKGEITFVHDVKSTSNFESWDCFLIELNPKSYIPFFIEYIKPIADNECICKLEEINDRDEAKHIISKTIYSSPNYSIEAELAFSYLQYVGYDLLDGTQLIGKIIDAIENGPNNMLVVDYNSKEVLIPANEELIESIDSKNKKLIMHLPEGLLDL